MSPSKSSPLARTVLLAALAAVSLAACKRESAPAAPGDGATPAATPPAGADAAPVALKDAIETTDRYVVGISYPAAANRYPGLAKALSDYAAAERAELMEAVDAFGNDKPTAPYELSLAFEQVVDTPQIVAVAADGSRYTGGAHGQPLIARFVWLPQQDKRLTSASLVPDPKGWQAVSDYVREQLHTAVVTRADEDELAATDRAALIKSTSRMIDEGTEPEPANFSEFVPVLDAAGHVAALRFVFPPYQVGPYADGTQTVDVPASVLLPHVAPEYAGLFAR
ncbi:Protein of unknown function [Pseudoxanthomonas sp. CF385]|uniref:DUF3298 and DUF4163 domain-containing protein n=1 Tax=Pseudoxanthomonas sp. CF385 TaxID=1881042 RepID=UPI0008862599|nr:DUF3298 and DUF4163 domain-containing protein [Pseudoxanthomonas sp. CF385]SDQ62359.1 Protein of unknown function [Pseudoxanthomonas sp. CF385]